MFDPVLQSVVDSVLDCFGIRSFGMVLYGLGILGKTPKFCCDAAPEGLFLTPRFRGHPGDPRRTQGDAGGALRIFGQGD